MPRRLLAALAIAQIAAIAVPPAQAESAADFYRGKNVRLVIPIGAGGTFALNALLFAKGISAHMPGHPTVTPDFMPGAGGMKGTNYVYNAAPKDGSVLGMPFPALVLAQHTRKGAAKYDAAKFQYIGRLADTTRVIFVWHTAKAQTIEALKHTQVVLAASGTTNNTFIDPTLANALAGTKFRLVTGYKGAASEAIALENGEAEAATSSLVNLQANRPDWFRDHKIRILIQTGLARNPELKDVPLLQELATNAVDRKVAEYAAHTAEVGYAFMAPPGVPAEYVAAWRKAFDAMMHDPAFIAEVKKRKGEIGYASAAQLTKVIHDALAAPPAVIERFIALTKS